MRTALILLLVLALVALATGYLLTRREAPVGGAASAPASDVPAASNLPPSNPPSSGLPSSGGSTEIVPVQARVSCQAQPSTDDAGRAVSYAPPLMFDGELATAWRCPGSGVRQSIIFAFASAVTINQVGLVNGYTKTDPKSGVHRYPEYRRITAATWTFPDGSTFPQTLVDGDEELQTTPVTAQPATQVTLTIDATTGAGSKIKDRNAVLISEVGFTG